MDNFELGLEIVNLFRKSIVKCSVCEEEMLGDELAKHLSKVHKKSNLEIVAIGIEIGKQFRANLGINVN